MTARQALDKDTLRSLLTMVRDTSWSWAEADVPSLAARFNWSDIELMPNLGAAVDPGHGLGSKAFRLSFDKGKVDRITMRISAKAEQGDAAGQLFLGNVFADASAVASEIFGQPTSRVTGGQPEIRWRGAETTLILKMLSMSVILIWTTSEFQEHWDSLS